MFDCDLRLVSCRRLYGKDKSYVRLTTEDMENPELRYTDFGEQFGALVGVPFGTVIRCEMYHDIDYKTGNRVSRINDFSIVGKEV